MINVYCADLTKPRVELGLFGDCYAVLITDEGDPHFSLVLRLTRSTLLAWEEACGVRTEAERSGSIAG